jgi:hypothetical protein
MVNNRWQMSGFRTKATFVLPHIVLILSTRNALDFWILHAGYINNDYIWQYFNEYLEVKEAKASHASDEFSCIAVTAPLYQWRGGNDFFLS